METNENTEINQSNLEWFSILGKLGVTAAGYPFEYVKVLIQIGHEPLPPRPTHTLLGRPALALPGVFTYMGHIRKIDGFWGLYRGLFPKLCTNFLSMSTYIFVYEKLPKYNSRDLFNKQDRDLSNEEKIILEAHELAKTSICRAVTIIVSHPFHIITIRTIAQFIGREEKYGGIFASLFEIARHDGILGFFSGLIPRLIGELITLWVASAATILINNYLVDEDSIKGYVRASMSYLASAVFYPFTVVSNVSIVNNCGLKAGLPTNMPIYSSWVDCWSHLKAIGQLKRGSSILWRYYSGPYMSSAYISSSGRIVHAQAFQYSLMHTYF